MKLTTANQIFIRRKNKVIIPPAQAKNHNDALVATLNKNIESLGYTMGVVLINSLRKVDTDTLKSFSRELISALRDLRKHRVYRPMYPNFPQQVMDMSDAELYLNATMHYLSVFVADISGDRELEWFPSYKKAKRDKLTEKTKLTIINVGTRKEFNEMFANIIASKTSISKTDVEDLQWFFTTHFDKDIKAVLPEVIPNKEVLATVAGLLIGRVDLSSYFKTATDVLRLAVKLSGGDVSLAEPVKFRNFNRAERRVLLELLENAGNITEDMLRWKTRWVRLGEKLHPSEYTRLRKVNAAFSVIRGDKKFQTFNSKVHRSLLEGNASGAVSLLTERAGDFARRLDHLLRIEATKKTVNKFASIADNVSTPVLMQVMTHFRNRQNQDELRTFFPKGSIAKVQAIKNNLPPIRASLCQEVVKVCENVLVDRFSKLSKLGKVYIDENLTNYLVPFSQRSASKALRTLVRGSRIPLDEGDTVRFFLWWKEGNVNGTPTGRVDIDLSAIMLDENWVHKGHISYYNLRDLGGHHSGDITSAPQGASEFIDVNLSRLADHGVRYVLPQVNSFTSQLYKNLPECFAGWMMRQYADSGEVYEPKTVQDRVDLTADTRICIPAIIDIKERQVIWADIALKNDPSFVNNVAANLSGTSLMVRAIATLKRPNLYDLFELHAKARGQLVKQPEKADVVFSVKTGTPFELEQISANYL